MGLFIELKIDQTKFATLAERQKVAGLCPVDALIAEEDGLRVHPENEDECTFCDLCVQQSPKGAIEVVKTYQEFMAK
ncbi:MAG TPA: ferredoxin [Chloroflexota bacterium]|nr:ferredoxin [Chloroflexota bacterium]